MTFSLSCTRISKKAANGYRGRRVGPLLVARLSLPPPSRGSAMMPELIRGIMSRYRFLVRVRAVKMIPPRHGESDGSPSGDGSPSMCVKRLINVRLELRRFRFAEPSRAWIPFCTSGDFLDGSIRVATWPMKLSLLYVPPFSSFEAA